MTHMNPYESAEQFRIILFIFRCGNSNATAFLMTTIKPEQTIQIELMRFNPKKNWAHA